MRLGAGKLTVPGPNPLARAVFLRAVAECTPEAFSALVATADDESALAAWATEWGFSDAWAFDFARRQKPFWREHPDFRAMIVSTYRWEPEFPAGPSWNPIKEPEAAYRARVDAYVASLNATPGLIATPEKQLDTVHFEWLARHHVARWTYDRIADKYANGDGYPDAPAVSNAITATAALVGLTLRPTRGRKLIPGR